MLLSVLPQELVDHIIDHLHDDSISLKCCALVCRAWLPATRSHIFRRISLQPPTATRRFFGWGRKPVLHSLLLVIQTTPEIASYIHDVEIVEGIGDKEWIASERALIALLLLMKNVQRFQLRHSAAVHIVWGALGYDLRSAVVQVLASPSLRELDMGMLAFGTAEELRRALGSSPGLRTLSLDHLQISESLEHPLSQEDSLQHHRYSPLDTLVLGARTSPRIVGCLLHPSSTLDITSLRNLTISISDNFGEFARLLRSAVGLISLELILMSDIDLQAYPSLPFSERLDLSYNPCIATLSVRFDVIQRQDDPLPWLNGLFSTFTTPNSLEQIHIVYSLYLPSPYMDRSVNTTIFSGWQEIDATLTGPVFDALEQVRLEFSLENPIGFGVAPRFLKEVDLRSPALQASDRLVVEAFDTSG